MYIIVDSFDTDRHMLSHLIIMLAARSFLFQPEKVVKKLRLCWYQYIHPGTHHGLDSSLFADGSELEI